MHFKRDRHAVLQERGTFADELFLQFELLVVFVIHEHERVALLVEELEILLLKAHAFHALESLEIAGELSKRR